ncbi:MAG: hypothetical protein V7606_646, partial [Burkholderiales bacterium]
MPGLSLGLIIQILRLFSRIVQFDRDAGRVFDEDLMQTEAGHRSVFPLISRSLQAGMRALQVGREKCNVVDCAGTRLLGGGLVPQVSEQSLRVVWVDPDDVDDAVIRLVFTVVKPDAGEFKGRTVAFAETENLGIEQ